MYALPPLHVGAKPDFGLRANRKLISQKSKLAGTPPHVTNSAGGGRLAPGMILQYELDCCGTNAHGDGLVALAGAQQRSCGLRPSCVAEGHAGNTSLFKSTALISTPLFRIGVKYSFLMTTLTSMSHVWTDSFPDATYSQSAAVYSVLASDSFV